MTCPAATLCTVYTGACSALGGCPVLCPSPWRISPAALSVACVKRLPASYRERVPGRPCITMGSTRGRAPLPPTLGLACPVFAFAYGCSVSVRQAPFGPCA